MNLFNEEWDKVEKPYFINAEKLANYNNAVACLSKLQADGLLTYKASDVKEPYAMHCVYVTWAKDDEDFVEIKSKTLAMLKDFDLSFDAERGEFWQLSTKLYYDN